MGLHLLRPQIQNGQPRVVHSLPAEFRGDIAFGGWEAWGEWDGWDSGDITTTSEPRCLGSYDARRFSKAVLRFQDSASI